MFRLIKKYNNRRMYDTKNSRPVTLFDLANLIKQGEKIQVIDHATGGDITPVVLVQIFLENLKSSVIQFSSGGKVVSQRKLAKRRTIMAEKKQEEIDLGLGKISLGGIFEGIGSLIDLASRLSEEVKEIKKEGEIKGLGDKVKGVYGFSIRTLSGKRPVVQTFGNIKRTKEGPVIEEVREPIVDVLEEKDFVRVIAELPGVTRQNIDIKVNGDILNLCAEKQDKKYAKEILLPFQVKQDPAEFSFKNGILELKIQKKESN
ncbi:Hsp20 family protein [Candidatus Aerophobetes bacterium]|nr:Hsp20 family protein [Candidatus Aerophobetes bacterium]